MERSTHFSARLHPGAHLYRGSDGGWRHLGPDGRFLRLRDQNEILDLIQPALHGHPPEDFERETEAAAAVTALRQQGLIAAREKVVDFSVRSVLIEGDTPIAELLSDLLGQYVRVTSGAITANVISNFDVVVSCVGWLRDKHWLAVDELCRSADITWHRCYAEGRSWVLGPMSLPGRTASYADTRARILAAAPHTELRDHWSYLDAELCQPPVPWPLAGARAIIAGVLASDVLAALSGDHIPSAGYQIVIESSTYAIERHPVLPLPAVWSKRAVRR